MQRPTWIVAIMHMQIKDSTIGSSTGEIKTWRGKTGKTDFLNDFYNALYVNQINTLRHLQCTIFLFNFHFNSILEKKKSSCFCSVLNLPFFAGFPVICAMKYYPCSKWTENRKNYHTNTPQAMCVHITIIFTGEIIKNNNNNKKNGKQK